jgi:hypothetical protein
VRELFCCRANVASSLEDEPCRRTSRHTWLEDTGAGEGYAETQFLVEERTSATTHLSIVYVDEEALARFRGRKLEGACLAAGKVRHDVRCSVPPEPSNAANRSLAPPINARRNRSTASFPAIGARATSPGTHPAA